MVTPQQSSHRNPTKCFRWEKDEQRSEREIAAGGFEGCIACEDVIQEQGVSKILTIDLNDMAKELNIK